MQEAPSAELEQQLEEHRTALTAYAYRMLGSPFEAEDAVQETFIRAWRNLDKFEGRAALRSWLYKIATNVCFDMLDSRKRRARPIARKVSAPFSRSGNQSFGTSSGSIGPLAWQVEKVTLYDVSRRRRFPF